MQGSMAVHGNIYIVKFSARAKKREEGVLLLSCLPWTFPEVSALGGSVLDPKLTQRGFYAVG